MMLGTPYERFTTGDYIKVGRSWRLVVCAEWAKEVA